MNALLNRLCHRLTPKDKILKLQSVLYLKCRLLCEWLEKVSPEVSQRSGFTYDLGWLTELDISEDPAEGW